MPQEPLVQQELLVELGLLEEQAPLVQQEQQVVQELLEEQEPLVELEQQVVQELLVEQVPLGQQEPQVLLVEPELLEEQVPLVEQEPQVLQEPLEQQVPLVEQELLEEQVFVTSHIHGHTLDNMISRLSLSPTSWQMTWWSRTKEPLGSISCIAKSLPRLHSVGKAQPGSSFPIDGKRVVTQMHCTTLFSAS